jgi:hypothetical protein
LQPHLEAVVVFRVQHTGMVPAEVVAVTVRDVMVRHAMLHAVLVANLRRGRGHGAGAEGGGEGRNNGDGKGFDGFHFESPVIEAVRDCAVYV